MASRLRQYTGRTFTLPSYDQVRRYIHTLQQEPKVRKERGEERGVRRERQSPLSFALSIPAPAQLAQVDEHTMELYVVTKDGIPVASRIHAAVLVCVKTAAIMSAVIALGPRGLRGLHAPGQRHVRAERSAGSQGRVSTRLALLRQARDHLPRPGQDLHV